MSKPLPDPPGSVSLVTMPRGPARNRPAVHLGSILRPGTAVHPGASVLVGAAVLLGVSALPPPRAGSQDASYRQEIEAWRVKRESNLKADGGWLTVAGLFWLKEGENRFGSGKDNEIVLPASAPARAGAFVVRGAQVLARFEPGVSATVDGRPVGVAATAAASGGAAAGESGHRLHADSSGKAEVVAMGPLQMHVIERGGRLAIRLKDMNAEARRTFTGLQWFPIDERLRVSARFVPHGELRPLAVPNILGQVEKMPSPGYAVFELDGREQRLSGVFESPGDTELFFIFKDGTSGRETYPAGRFLYSGLPKEGRIVLDFNKAYNPPCAFTEYATCPLPPKENWLTASVKAGELRHGH